MKLIDYLAIKTLTILKRYNHSPVKNHQVVTRFISNKRLHRKDAPRLHHNAFKPPKKYPDEVSVYKMLDMSDEDIWALADQHVNKNVIGRGDILVSDIHSDNDSLKNVVVLEAPYPHKKHANIKNIPIENSQRLAVSHRLSFYSKLKLKTL